MANNVPSDKLEMLYRGILDTALECIITMGADGRVLEFNPAAERVFGFTRAEAVGKELAELIIPPQLRDVHRRGLAHYLKTGEGPVIGKRIEIVGVRKDGSTISVELAITAVKIESAPIFVAYLRDITDRKSNEESSRRLAAIVESSDDAIVSKDLNGIITSWNAGAARLFGYTAEEAIKKPITIIVPPDRYHEEQQILDRIHSGERVDHLDTVRRRKDGTLVNVSLSVSPVKNSDGRVIGASKIARDIREHKRLLDERRVAAANEEAARREVLEVQNRRIQEAARLKSEFVANMSHELRTPLNSILGFAELMADARFGPLPDRYQQFANVMHSSAQHLLQLINDILDLAKVESGKIDFQAEPVDLPQLVSETTEIIGGLALKRKIEVTVDVDPALGIVHLDPIRLKQVLYNYLSNAIKFTPEGGLVAVRVRPEERDCFRIEVEDNGIGIKPDDLHRLFIEFQQLDASTAKRFAGSGLGLALTKRLVEAQGGRVGVHSVFGSGSTFFATLPRHVTAETADITARVMARVP